MVPNHSNDHKLIGLIKSICRLIQPNGSSFVSLDQTALLKKAIKQTGLDDFGDESFQEPLRVLLKSFDSDAKLNLIGRICVYSDILRLLCNRLHIEADRKRNPKIRDQLIRRPLFITGLPRTGSTLLHALLARDPEARAPQVWEVMHPSPPPERASYGTDARIAATSRELMWLDVLMPGFKVAHMMTPQLPQECIAITGHAFISYVFESMYFVRSYRTWHEDLDKRPAYKYHKRFLQHLQAHSAGSHWVLKAPSHLLSLDALVNVYPDAGIVMTHRDPVKVLASCASFAEVLRSPFTDCLDKKELGREVSERWEKGARLAVSFRKTGPGERFFDVIYEDLLRDPLSVVRRIYAHFDMELTEQAERAMQRFLHENPKNKKGVHRYSLVDFGLERETERRRFEFYSNYFGIGTEA